MLTIKHDENLIRSASVLGVTPEELTETVRFLADLDEDDIDPYAGETLGKLLSDQPDRWSSFYGERIPDRHNTLDQLKLRLWGAENPCPECGWEVSEREEDHMIICPHCGWSRPMFLSEQNDE